MKSSRSSLILIEQIVMVLVFAIAAALCLQAFVESDNLSRRSERQDRALLCAQNAMETVRACRGDMYAAAELLGAQYPGEDKLMIDYDSDWNPADGHMRYTLGAVTLVSGVDGLGMAEIWVRDELENRELLRMDISWQEPLPSEVSYGTAG